MKNSNQQEHVFLEDITYCPSQIYYYFTDPDEEKLWVAYVRQRSGPLSFELVEIERETGKWLWDWDGRGTNGIQLSGTYDINNQPNEEEKEKAIVKVEEEVMWFLRQQFPHLDFPKTPKRIKRWFVSVLC